MLGVDSDREQYGLHEESAPTPASSTVVDIIFVHGLGGTPKGTWTHNKDAFWPIWLRDIKGLENSRILVFGYDSDWKKVWKPNTTLNISDIATQLLNHLLHHCSATANVIILLK
jgi:hypothetical protein